MVFASCIVCVCVCVCVSVLCRNTNIGCVVSELSVRLALNAA